LPGSEPIMVAVLCIVIVPDVINDRKSYYFTGQYLYIISKTVVKGDLEKRG